MLFNSWEFLVLLGTTLLLYYVPWASKAWQINLLLLASAVFYGWSDPRLLLLLLVSCLCNAVAVERILFWKNKIRCFGESVAAPSPGVAANADEPDLAHRSNPSFTAETPKHRNTAARKARHWLTAAVALNLAFLAFFKYAGFLAGLLPETPATEALKLRFTDIPLPIGISFYTFQGISLIVDAWRGDVSRQTAERLGGVGRKRLASWRDIGFYISFFPQLIAGPIVKARGFIDQIGTKSFSDIDWRTVRRSLVCGYFLKIFVADNLAEQTAALTAGGAVLAERSVIDLLSLLYSYSLQIFADFAGYSLIAIGLGALFGYRLPENFRFPYLSRSITEVWTRWHLSLSSWLKDYLYIPLGGNRKGTGRTYFNLFLVMFLGGLWHGAAWKFALWGSLHGLALAVERLRTRASDSRSGTVDQRSKADDHGLAIRDQTSTIHYPQSTVPNLLSAGLRWFLTFHLVTALWLTFMMPDMASIAAFFQGLAAMRPGFTGPPLFALLFYGSSVVLYHGWGWLCEHHPALGGHLSRGFLEPCIHACMVFLILTNPGAPRGFIYFQF